jgi:hypothetical protein
VRGEACGRLVKVALIAVTSREDQQVQLPRALPCNKSGPAVEGLHSSGHPCDTSAPHHPKPDPADTQVAFKANQFPQAIQHYSRSADMSLSRPPWEPSVLSRDETTIALCNRSAAFALAGAW